MNGINGQLSNATIIGGNYRTTSDIDDGRTEYKSAYNIKQQQQQQRPPHAIEIPIHHEPSTRSVNTVPRNIGFPVTSPTPLVSSRLPRNDTDYIITNPYATRSRHRVEHVPEPDFGYDNMGRRRQQQTTRILTCPMCDVPLESFEYEFYKRTGMCQGCFISKNNRRVRHY